MKSVFLNTYEQIILQSILTFPEDLLGMKLHLKIFSDDFISVYDFVFNFHSSYNKLPTMDILKAEFSGINVINNNAQWAFDEQTKFWKRQGYLDIVREIITLLDNKDFNDIKVQRAFAKYQKFDASTKKTIDIEEVNKYLTAEFVKLNEMDTLSKYMGRGLDNPSLNVMFANSHQGKSVFSAKFASVLAKNKIKTLIISPEMQWQVMLKMIYSFYYQENTLIMKPEKLKKIEEYLTIHTDEESIDDWGAYLTSVYKQYDFVVIDSFYELTDSGDSSEEYGSQNSFIKLLVNKIKIPKLITTQAKPEVIGKKLNEITMYDVAFTKRASYAADYIGFLRKDKDNKDIIVVKNVKARLRDYSIHLEEYTKYRADINNGIYQEIPLSQLKHQDI